MTDENPKKYEFFMVFDELFDEFYIDFVDGCMWDKIREWENELKRYMVGDGRYCHVFEILIGQHQARSLFNCSESDLLQRRRDVEVIFRNIGRGYSPPGDFEEWTGKRLTKLEKHHKHWKIHPKYTTEHTCKCGGKFTEFGTKTGWRKHRESYQHLRHEIDENAAETQRAEHLDKYHKVMGIDADE